MSSYEKSALECLASAIYNAALKDLPDQESTTPDTRAMVEHLNEHGKYPDVTPSRVVLRRPRDVDIEVIALFSTTWGSRALGFEYHLSQSAMTPAYTVCLRGPSGHYAVYFAGRFAYLVDPATVSPAQLEAFQAALSQRFLQNQSKAKELYGAAY